MSTYPPDGWIVGRGTWGVDVLQDTGVFATGSASVKLTNSLLGDVKYLVSVSYPCRPNDVFLGSAILRGTDVGGGVTGVITVALYWYDSAGSFISSSSIFAGTYSNPNQWFDVSGIIQAPSSAVSYKILCIKADTGFSCWFDNVEIHPVAASFFAYNASATTVVATSWSQVTDLRADRTSCWDYGATWDNSNSRMTGRSSREWGDLWYITGHVTVQSVPNGKYIQARIYDVSGSRAIYGMENVNGSGGTIGLTAMVGGIIDASNWISPALGVYTSNGSNLTTYTGINDCWISGFRIL